MTITPVVQWAQVHVNLPPAEVIVEVDEIVLVTAEPAKLVENLAVLWGNENVMVVETLVKIIRMRVTIIIITITITITIIINNSSNNL